jgi:aminoglycoside/choline kinase family phosphotransferase
MNKILDNDQFREILQTVDDTKLTETAIYYVPFAMQQQSLLINEEYFYDWLVNNYLDFGFSETEELALMQSEMQLFLSTQTREEKFHIYRDFMTSNGIIEDLLYLNLDERQELLMELGVVIYPNAKI